MRIICAAVLSWGVLWSGGFAAAAPAAPAERAVAMRYVAHVTGVPEGAAELRLWLPVPRDDAHQEISAFAVTSPFPYELTTEELYGNKTVYLQVTDPPAAFDVEMDFRVRRRENVAGSERRDGVPRELALAAQRLVPLADDIRELAEGLVAGLDTPMAQGRALYDHTLAYMTYDKSGTGWGRGDYRYACCAKRGNCTDFHSYFIALCRNVGLGAFFEIGVSLPPARGAGTISGYHCWAYFQSSDEWVPVDISEADKYPARAEYFFGNHDENRVAFTRGRDLLLSPRQQGEPLNFFINPYAEVDGEVFDGVSREIFFEDLET